MIVRLLSTIAGILLAVVLVMDRINIHFEYVHLKHVLQDATGANARQQQANYDEHEDKINLLGMVMFCALESLEERVVEVRDVIDESLLSDEEDDELKETLKKKLETLSLRFEVVESTLSKMSDFNANQSEEAEEQRKILEDRVVALRDDIADVKEKFKDVSVKSSTAIATADSAKDEVVRVAESVLDAKTEADKAVKIAEAAKGIAETTSEMASSAEQFAKGAAERAAEAEKSAGEARDLATKAGTEAKGATTVATEAISLANGYGSKVDAVMARMEDSSDGVSTNPVLQNAPRTTGTEIKYWVNNDKTTRPVPGKVVSMNNGNYNIITQSGEVITISESQVFSINGKPLVTRKP